MSAADLAENILLAAGVLIQLACSIGVLVMPDALPRLHYIAPASSVGMVLIAIAVIIPYPLSQSCAKVILIAAAILISGPVLSIATARAIKMRDEGRLDEDGGE